MTRAPRRELVGAGGPRHLPERPRLAVGVELHEPPPEGGAWIVQSGSGGYTRVGADMARLLEALDGERTFDDLVESLGAPWDRPTVEQAVSRLEGMRLLHDDDRPVAVPRGRRAFVYVPPLTFQLTVMRPERLFSRLDGVIRVLGRRSSLMGFGGVVAAGIVALGLQVGDIVRALGRPLPITVLLAVVAASFLTSALHEVGHGAALAHEGGRASRLGVMLFYLSPAFFCDVTDGWRLGRRQARVRVALAGIAVQAVLVAVTAVVALGLELGRTTPWRDALLVFAVSTAITAAMNLIPFVKLDGYIALMSHLDVPYLREKAMRDARRSVACVLFGGTYARELGVPWAVPFGLASIAFPIVLVVLAAQLWLGVLLGFGIVGAAVALIGLVFLVRTVVVEISRFITTGVAAGARRGRIVVAALGAVLGTAFVLAYLPVPYTVAGGFVQEDGRTYFVATRSADLQAAGPGAVVTIVQRGIVTSRTLGVGTIGTDAAVDGVAPMTTLLPLSAGTDVQLPVRRVALSSSVATDVRSGSASVDAGTRSLGTWLWLNYVAQFWR